MTKYTKTLLLGLIFSLISCASTPVTQEFYILNSSSKLSDTSGKPFASIRSVSLPVYLENKGITTLKGNKINISLTELWAEELETAIPQLLATQIEKSLRKSVILHPIPAGISVKKIIEVDIYKLIADEDNLYLEAKYKILKGKSIQSYNFKTSVRLPNKTVSAITKAHETALVKLAQKIAQHM